MNKFATISSRRTLSNEMIEIDSSNFRVAYVPASAGVYSIFIYGPILDATQFIDAIQAMAGAGENDVVLIYLSTPGGSLDVADTFLQAMRTCQARICVHASGGVHSAGTLILLNADEFTLSENFNCLIHNGSVGQSGKFSDWRVEAEYTTAYMERVMRSTYKGFLTEDEMVRLLDGKNIWLDAEGFMARWYARNELLEAEEAE